MFSTLSKTEISFLLFNLSSANAFNFVSSKISWFGNGLNEKTVPFSPDYLLLISLDICTMENKITKHLYTFQNDKISQFSAMKANADDRFNVVHHTLFLQNAWTISLTPIRLL